MPAEYEPHSVCIMTWLVRGELWNDRIDGAKVDYAAVAAAIVRFEPVLMVCPPGQEEEGERACNGTARTVPSPINDSWTRDHSPVFALSGSAAPVARRGERRLAADRQ